MAQPKKVLREIKFWTPLRVASTVIVLGLLAAFGVSSCNSTESVVKSGTRPKVTAKAGLNTLPREILDAENRAASGAAPIKLADYSGKILLINLWATWCGPCRIETPELVKLHKEFQSRGVELIGLSTEDPDTSAEMVMDFVREYEVDYQIGFATREVAQTLMAGRPSIPQTYIIARDGRIIRRLVGFNPSTTPAQLKQALEEALIEKG